jgi:hypothetical protein
MHLLLCGRETVTAAHLGAGGCWPGPKHCQQLLHYCKIWIATLPAVAVDCLMHLLWQRLCCVLIAHYAAHTY